jgi:hypothetical protein
MPSDVKIPDATPKPRQRPNLILSPIWVPVIFYFHFAIVYLFVVLFWCHLFYQEHSSIQERLLDEISKLQLRLFLGIPIAISFAGIVARVKWAPYVIVDLIISLLAFIWIIAIRFMIFGRILAKY